jgi:3-deoxy-D-manno-octulosonic-acid transferase
VRFFYNLIFLLFAVVSLPHAYKRRRANADYRGMGKRRWGCPEPQWLEGFPKVWLNGVSVGEVISLGPLIKIFETTYPGIRLVISATTGTGYKRIQKLYPQHQAVGLPLDFSFIVDRRLKKFKPEVIICAELDLWPNFLMACQKFKIPFIVVGGRISESSCRGYQKIKGLLREPFSGVALFLAQDGLDATRAKAIGIPEQRVEVGGNLKFDLLKTQAPEKIPLIEKLKATDSQWLVLASSHAPEEKIFMENLLKSGSFHSLWRLIVVPRHPERRESVRKDLEELGAKVQFFSAIENGAEIFSNSVIVVDRIGVLLSLYSMASLAFVGGSLIPHGGQNMIEPAALGCPVIFGPHVKNFREATELLLSSDAAIQVEKLENLSQLLAQCLDGMELRLKLSQNAREAIRSRQGAAEKIFKRIQPYFSQK